MPSQDLTVRVRVQGMGKYASEMQQGAKATRQLSTAGENIQKVGGRISGIGDKLTKSVTLPILAVGVAATKMATDFDNSFTQMQTLAGLSSGEVDGLKESVLGLAGETGRAPQELAEALYFLRSSGLEGADAMEALEVSAKASAAGLGDTQTIADAVSSAMLGYAESGLEAAEATDVLIATARAGKAEPAELAGQMGRLIPIAAELGISFGDVGGAIAALSTRGNSAADATTQLSNVMAKLMSPSRQAADLLDEVGLSSDRLKGLIAEKGLLGTLEVLKERLGDSGFKTFFEDIQAKQGALALLGGNLEETRDIFEQVNESVGATDEAFATWAESMGAKNARAFAEFQVALIRVGDVIAPIAADLLSFVASAVGAFGDLPEPVQQFALALAAVAAAVGPLMSVGGRLISLWGSVVKVFDNWTSAGGRGFADAMNGAAASSGNLSSNLASVGRTLAAGGAVITGLVLVGELAEKAFAPDRADISQLENALLDLGEASKITGELASVAGDDLGKLGSAVNEVFDPSLGEQAEHFQDTIGSLGGLIAGDLNKIEKAKNVIDDVDKALAQLANRDPEAAAAVFEEITTQLGDMGVQGDHVKAAFDDYSATLAEADTANRTAEDSTESSTLALADQEQAVNEAAEAYGSYADTIKATLDPLFGLLDALRGNKDAQIGVVEAQAHLDEVMADSESTAADVAQAQRDLESAMIGVGTSAEDVTLSAAALNAAVAENPALLDDARQSLRTWREQGLIPSERQLEFLEDQLEATALSSTALGRTDPRIDVSTNGTVQSRVALGGVLGAALSIPPTRHVSVSTSGTQYAIGQLDSVARAINNVSAHGNVHVSVGGGGGFPLAGGGVVPRYLAVGGMSGPRGTDTVPAWLTPGEVVLNGGQQSEVLWALANGAGRWAAAEGGMAGGGDTFVFNMDGSIIGSQRQFDRMVQQAFNTRSRKGRGINA